MFNVRTALANIRRYRYKSLLNILICIAAVLFLNLYTGNLEKSREQLESLPDKIPVEATITNLQGGRESGIFIKEALYDGVMQGAEVKEPRFTLSLIGNTATAEYKIQAANTWKAISGLDEKMLQFAERNAESFFSSDIMECLVREDVMEEYQLKEGDNLPLDLEYYELVDHTEIYAHPLEHVTFKIIGTLKEETEAAAEGDTLPQIIVPIEAVRDIYHRQGIRFFVDSGMFFVKDPLRLNDFKEEMKKIGFMEVITQAEPFLEGNALVVRDETFIKASGSLGEGYRVMRNFMPVICVVLAGAGFITSYLLTNGRRQEYATLRSLGMTKRTCTAVYLLEHGTSELVGGVIGTGLSAWLIEMENLWYVVDFIAFILCFLAGTFTAIVMLGRTSVMEVLAKAD